MIILWIIFAIASCALGSSKGYNGIGCFFAGLIGGVITFIVLLFLPNKREEEEYVNEQQRRAQNQERKIRELQKQVDEVTALKKRITELENAQQANKSVETETAAQQE